MDGKFIAYYRVSTEHQGCYRQRYGCAAQIQRRVALAVARSYSCARRLGHIAGRLREGQRLRHRDRNRHRHIALGGYGGLVWATLAARHPRPLS